MSKIVAIMPVRNEAWCIGLTLRALLMWVDEAIITMHCCTDNTQDIVHEIMRESEHRTWSNYEADSVWHEMQQRDSLLQSARHHGATHVCITDADELISGNLLPHMRRMVESTPKGSVLQLPWVQLKGSTQTYIASGMWSQQCASTAFPDDPAYCWRPQAGDYQHHHRHPMGKPTKGYMPLGRDVRKGGVMHLQMTSDKRLRWKQYHYLCQEILRWPGRKTPAELNAMYGPTVNVAPGTIMRTAPSEWWAPYAHLMGHLNVDVEPWQAEACRQLWKEHGPEKFAGLDLFGVEL